MCNIIMLLLLIQVQMLRNKKLAAYLPAFSHAKTSKLKKYSSLSTYSTIETVKNYMFFYL